MSSDQDKPPRPNPHIGAELGVESVPLSERSRRLSESAGQASLSYATSGPTTVPAPEKVTTDMPPVILDPNEVAAAPPPSPSSGGVLAAAPAFSSVSGVKIVPKTVRMATAPNGPGAPGAPTSQPQLVAEPRVSSSGSFATMPESTPSSRQNARARTVVVRARRASPIEKAFAFAAALVLICTIGAAIFYWQGRRSQALRGPETAPRAATQNAQTPR